MLRSVGKLFGLTFMLLAASAGLQACLDALRPAWTREREAARTWNAGAAARGESRRRGVGIGAMWYGIGNTALANPDGVPAANVFRRAE